MSLPWWIFVLVLVVFPSSDARLHHECEHRERSLCDLDRAEDALNEARQLVPNCEEENESSNSSECCNRDKSLVLIDAALGLISDAKKNIPICPLVPTQEPLIKEESTPDVTAEISTPDVTTSGRLPMDCQELQAAGQVTSGVYTVWPAGKSVQVRCDMDTAGGGWTVIQRRGKFSVEVNFDLEWSDYKTGFGILEGEFWLGNDIIFDLTNQGNYSLRLDMTAVNGDSAYALYEKFRSEDEKANYKLHLDYYSGTAGNFMSPSNNEAFTTKDRMNIRLYKDNCAKLMKGGFWYFSCANCNPNGLYKPGVKGEDTMYYNGFKGREGLASFEMKIKRL